MALQFVLNHLATKVILQRKVTQVALQNSYQNVTY